ncbi:MAG: calcium-translocating P-type ATPase, PMCA-type [Christensenellales bacterium]
MNASYQPIDSAQGLTPDEVARSRERHGDNAMKTAKRHGFFSQFLASFGDPIIKVLLAALAINVIFLFHHSKWYESMGIAVAVFLATFVSTLSEYGSESAFIKLQEEAARINCRVRRFEGVLSLPIAEVVVGDLVLLQAGEQIPADGVLISGSLTVDQSALNGESREVEKRPADELPQVWELDRRDEIFRGSVITAGEGVMRVCRVGSETFYGNLSDQLQENTRQSPLKVKLGGLAGVISKIGYCAAVLVALGDLFNSFVLDNGFQWALIAADAANIGLVMSRLMHALTLAITVVVVAVPEGLPMMITVVLSSNMLRMLKDHVMVRKLVGIETAGGLNILFTDKTGTLTRGQLSVETFVAGDGRTYPAFDRLPAPLARWAALSGAFNTSSVISDKSALGGNATDRALLNYALPLAPQLNGYTRSEMRPFDSTRKCSSCRLSGPDLTGYLVKGAPEKLLPQCGTYLNEQGQRMPLDRARVQREMDRLTARAVRVLVLATADRPIPADGPLPELTLIGLAGIRDEIRPEVPGAIAEVQGAGVQVVMITGDNQQTATAIAREVGLIRGEEKGAVLTSAELSAMSDEAVKSQLPRLRVIARALPSDKSRLVRLAQELDLVVGMTGDGINDAPALKAADVGFAMGSGTEVAKEAGDIVILDNNFASIDKAILYGRTIFKSIRKFVVYQLTMNLCAVGISLIGPFIGIDTPVTVIQMLWINIIMDTLSGLAFAGEPALPEYMLEAPKRRDEPVLNRNMLLQILSMGLFNILLSVVFLKGEYFHAHFAFDDDPIHLMTGFFALFIFAGIFTSLNTRTHRLNLLANLRKNPSFICIISVVACIQILMIYFGGPLFRTEGLPVRDLMMVIGMAFLVIPVDMVRRLLLRIGHQDGAF